MVIALSTLLCKSDYEAKIAASRDERMKWWREARYGMFIHYGLFSIRGAHEWAWAMENSCAEEYEELKDQFLTKPGAPREWVQLAKRAGMKYCVMVTRHHEGFSLWDSKVNPFNSVNYGPKRDLVREFVDACREFDMGIGFYSSLMDWHHPDGGRCAYDMEARKRFNDYILGLNRELMSNYGKIDILWYDVSAPMESWEGWDSLTLNQMVRELQPHIIIDDRSKLAEDFGTPEGHIQAQDRDWEACMTFNDLSWGYIDSRQAIPYSYNAQRILRMLWQVTKQGGNLLLNIGPTPDGSVPEEAVEPLEAVGRWLDVYGEAVYGSIPKEKIVNLGSMGRCSMSNKGEKVYLWNWIWPADGTMTLGGFETPLLKARILGTNEEIEFEQKGHRIFLKNLPLTSPDTIANVSMIELTFEETPKYTFASYIPQLHGGKEVARD